MKKVIYNDIIPFKGFKAITLWPFIFARKKYNPLDNVTVNHESTHLIQQLEVIVTSLLIIAAFVLTLHLSLWWLLLSLASYYAWYCIEYVIRLFAYGRGHEADRNIAFEQEAYLNEKDLSYLPKHRKAFAWFKYLTKKSFKR